MRVYYRHPKLYNLVVSTLLYSKGLWEKFNAELGENQTIFEVAAGYGRVAEFIDPSNKYYGIDLNKIFVEHGRSHGIDLEVKDIFDPTAYKRSDVFIAVDLIHHLTPEKLKGLFDLIFSHAAKKVIIMEASFSPMKRYGILGKVAEWIFKSLDTDGINKIERVMTNQEYRQLFESRFGSRYGEKFDFQYQLVGGRCLYQLVTYTHVAD